MSLSHEPNKAMNLNSYMGLMGGFYREVRTVTGTALVPSRPDRRALYIPDPDYIVTLDADSVLLPEYCLRMVHLLEQKTAPPVPGQAAVGQADALRRAVPAVELHGVDLMELDQPAHPAGVPVRRHVDQPAARPGGAPPLHGAGQRPALLGLQAARRVPLLRLQPGAAPG